MIKRVNRRVEYEGQNEISQVATRHGTQIGRSAVVRFWYSLTVSPATIRGSNFSGDSSRCSIPPRSSISSTVALALGEYNFCISKKKKKKNSNFKSITCWMKKKTRVALSLWRKSKKKKQTKICLPYGVQTLRRLRLFRHFDPFRILVCSGDGSVGWVLSEIDRLGMHVSKPAWWSWAPCTRKSFSLLCWCFCLVWKDSLLCLSARSV